MFTHKPVYAFSQGHCTLGYHYFPWGEAGVLLFVWISPLSPPRKRFQGEATFMLSPIQGPVGWTPPTPGTESLL